ncbi:MAG: hypothetical protein WAT78_02850 [Rhizobiaceae bacterium]
MPGTDDHNSINEKSGSAFVRSVNELLKRTEYRRCENGEDEEAIYRLRYESYRNSQLMPELDTRTLIDKHDNDPNCMKYAVYIDGNLVSTIRIHHLTRETPMSATFDLFEPELRSRLERGETFIDPSRLAADPAWTSIHRSIPYITLRIAVAATDWFDVTSCLSVVRDEHAAFYKRIFHSELAGDSRRPPGMMVNCSMFESRTDTNMQRTLERYPFFRSTAREQRMLFSRPLAGVAPAVTVLPGVPTVAEAA